MAGSTATTLCNDHAYLATRATYLKEPLEERLREWQVDHPVVQHSLGHELAQKLKNAQKFFH